MKKATITRFLGHNKFLLHLLTRAIHTILGVPRYEEYLAHFSAHHPGDKPLSQKEFYRKAQDERHADGKIRRCC